MVIRHEHRKPQETYLRPDLSKLYSPHLMKDMDILVRILKEAIQEERKIRIIGDICLWKNYSQIFPYFFPNKDSFTSTILHIAEQTYEKLKAGRLSGNWKKIWDRSGDGENYPKSGYCRGSGY